MASNATNAALRLVEKNDMDKEKALESALAQIERAFGKGSIMRLGEAGAAVEIESVSTGSLGLDIALGIGGSLRNSKIVVPDQPGVRPTPDRVRETLFNWLTPILPGARVLDLFAGTGALGIEAISRGAAEFVESDQTLCSKLTAELVRLKIADQGRVTRAAVPGPNAFAHTPVDIVFLDPPFSSDLWLPSLAAIAASGVLKAGGVIYLEAPIAMTLTRAWQPMKQSKAGAVHFGLYRFQPLDTPNNGAA